MYHHQPHSTREKFSHIYLNVRSTLQLIWDLTLNLYVIYDQNVCFLKYYVWKRELKENDRNEKKTVIGGKWRIL